MLFKYILKTAAAVENATSKINPLIVFCTGLLFCILAVILPELLPALKGQAGFVWSPIHSQNYHLGDLYYYGAWLKEVLEAGIPAYSPSAGELFGQPLIETWRFLGLGLAALPGLVISDIRILIVFDYGFSAALFFCIAYLFAYTLSGNHWIGIVTGITVLFMTDRLWFPLLPKVQQLIDSWKIAASFFSTVMDYLRYTSNFIEYDIYGSTFRFINISMSGPILLLFYFITTLVYKHADIKSCSVLFIISPLMAFTYPSHTIIAYGLLVTFCLVALFRRHWKAAISFFSVGTFTIILLEIIEYRKMLSELFNKSELWNGIFASEKLVLLNNEIGFILGTMLLNKYLLTFILMVYLTRKRPLLRDIVFATGMIAIPLFSVNIFSIPQLWTRFFARGIDHIWFMLLIVVLANALQQIISRPVTKNIRINSMAIISRRILSVAVFAVFFAMVALIATGFINLAKHTASNGSRFLPQETMKAYQWIDKNLPQNSEVATLDWEDITLLPIFTNVNLVVGHSLIDGRSPLEELRRFTAEWKFLGYDRQQLERLLDIGPVACLQMRQPASYTNPPRLPVSYQFDAAQFMEGILYWPYIRKMNGMQITEDKTASKLTTEFKQFVLGLYDISRPDDFIHKYKVEYITMNTGQVSLLGPPKGMRLLHKTKTRSIYGQISSHSSDRL
jgi:hypothetical protein